MMRDSFTLKPSPEGSRSWRIYMSAGLLLLFVTCLPRICFAATSCRGTPTVTVNASGVAFGNYDPLSAALTTSTGSVTVSATCGFSNLPFIVSYSVALSTGSSGTFIPRSMAFGASKLQYNLYTTAALTNIWGDGTSGTQIVSDALQGTCAFQFLGVGFNCSGSNADTMHGSVSALQNIVAGVYSDTITVTITF